MILTFESFNNKFKFNTSIVQEHRHAEVLEAAKEVIDNKYSSNFLMNFSILFAQTYGSNCENWLSLEENTLLVDLYASDENDFITGVFNVSLINEEQELMNKTIEEKIKQGWKIVAKYFESGVSEDGYRNEFEIYEYILYRHKMFNSKQINNVNRKIGVFENFQEKSLSFRDLYKVMKIKFDEKYVKTIFQMLKNSGLKVTNVNFVNNSYYFHINGLPMTFSEDVIHFNFLEKETLAFIKKHPHLEKFILTNLHRKFYSTEELVDFFKTNEVLLRKSTAEANNATGVFENYKSNNDESFRDVWNGMKNNLNKTFCYDVFKKLKKAGFKVVINPDMYYDFTINTVPMQIVNNYEVSFDNEKIFSTEGRFENGVWKNIDRKKEKLAPSFADKHPELMQHLKKFGVEGAMGGPKFGSVDEIIKFFEVNVDFYLNKSVRRVMKTGVFDD